MRIEDVVGMSGITFEKIKAVMEAALADLELGPVVVEMGESGRIYEEAKAVGAFGFEENAIHISQVDVNDVSELSEHVPLGQRIRGVLLRTPSTVEDLAEELGTTESSVRGTLRRIDAIELPGKRMDSRGNQRKVWGIQENHSTDVEIPL